MQECIDIHVIAATSHRVNWDGRHEKVTENAARSMFVTLAIHSRLLGNSCVAAFQRTSISFFELSNLRNHQTRNKKALAVHTLR